MTEPFEKLILATRKIATAALEAGIDPQNIAVGLSQYYWFEMLSDKNLASSQIFHPEQTRDQFRMNGILVLNGQIYERKRDR